MEASRGGDKKKEKEKISVCLRERERESVAPREKRETPIVIL